MGWGGVGWGGVGWGGVGLGWVGWGGVGWGVTRIDCLGAESPQSSQLSFALPPPPPPPPPLAFPEVEAFMELTSVGGGTTKGLPSTSALSLFL
jgi:hypothetical protein